MDGVLADYSADAVFFGPEGALRRPNAIKPVFEKMFAEFAKPGASVARKQRLIEGNTHTSFGRPGWASGHKSPVQVLGSASLLQRHRHQAYFARKRRRRGSRIRHKDGLPSVHVIFRVCMSVVHIAIARCHRNKGKFFA
jgi:hypothetical protein